MGHLSLTIKKYIKQRLFESIETDEALILKRIPSEKKIAIKSDLSDERKASQETFKNKGKFRPLFSWNDEIKAWVTSDSNLAQAKDILSSINKTEMLISKLEELDELIIDTNNIPTSKTNELDQKIKSFIEDLANATDEAAADAKLKQYLNFFSKFSVKSFNNSVLIFIQRPDATRVEGFQTWINKFHRKVRKGSKGIMIFKPIFSKTDKNFNVDKEEDVVDNGRPISYGITYVYDISDTDPIDERGNLPEAPRWFDDNTPSETADQLFKYVEVVIQELGINLTQLDAKGGEKGYSSGDHINLTSNIEGVGRLSTIIHELAHELMHWRKSSPFYDEKNMEANRSRELKELQAESVSYTVLRNYNIPVVHHATYLALWKANKEKIQANMNIIITVSKFIIKKIDKIAEDFKNEAPQ